MMTGESPHLILQRDIETNYVTDSGVSTGKWPCIHLNIIPLSTYASNNICTNGGII